MYKGKVKWLPHLTDSIPDSVKGYSMGFYSIALEGWRRGLSLKFINENRVKSEVLFELSSDTKAHKFVVSRGDLISRETMRICRNKIETKKYLQAANVSTPDGKRFEEKINDSEIINYGKQKGFPLVVKPTDGTGGKGVIAGINNEDELVKALKYVRNDLGYKDVIVEEYFKGEDFRAYVVGNEVVAVTKRIPANIIGDGKHTVKELIDKKNYLRKQSPILRSSLIKLDKELYQMLKQQGYKLDSIPAKDKVVYLKSKNNISAGGDPVDITDEVSDEIKKVAIEGVKAIPNLPHAGVDLLVDLKNNSASIIEINTQANIRTHLFPMSGTARDVPKKIIDYYFPETKDIEKNTLIYFDFEPIWELFQKGAIKEYILPKIPNENIEITRFTVGGSVQRVNYGKWIRKQARNLKLDGYIKHLKNSQSSIVVTGQKDQVEKFRKLLKTTAPKEAQVLEVTEKERQSPVKVGFEIINKELDKPIKDGYYPVRLEGMSKIGRYAKKESKNTKKNNVYKKELEKVLSSTSWKITKPLRVIRKILKR